MALSDLLRRLSIGALSGALLTVVMPSEPLAARQGCTFGEEGNDILDQRSVPGGGTITYVTRPHFVCADGVQIWADSAVAYTADAMSHLIGRVRYRDRSRELTAREARYFANVGRLQAQGNVVVVDRADGSRVENGDLVYLRQTDFREQESMTFATGRDGRRPRATLPPPEPDPQPADSGAAPAPASTEEPSPYTVVGDRLVFEGSDYFSATGTVEIERDSLFAYADSAEYLEADESLVLVGSARVLSSEYELVGRTITLGTDTGTNEIRAVREARLTGEDLTLTAPVVKLYLVDGAVERLVAVPLPGPETDVPGLLGLSTAPPEDARTPASRPSAEAENVLPPDSADLTRPVAVAERFELTADSLELSAPGEVVERIFAAGTARSVSQARDSLNVEALPELARQDWLEGDTIVINLQPAPADSLAPPASDSAAASEREYVIETIVARVGARSLYRLPPQDSTARAGVDLPAVHYVLGEEITIQMSEGEVEAMHVVGQTRGVHLEPIRRADATGDTVGVDTMGVGSGPVVGTDGPPSPTDGVAPEVRSPSGRGRPGAPPPPTASPAAPSRVPSTGGTGEQ